MSQYASHNHGRVVAKTATVARTDIAPKSLFTLPARAVLSAIRIFGSAASNAGTTAVLDVGKTGDGDFFVDGQDVKTAASGAGQVVPNALNLGSVGDAPITVIASYAETGAASSAGGPWMVIIEYLEGV